MAETRITGASRRRIEQRFGEGWCRPDIAAEAGINPESVTTILRHTESWQRAQAAADAGNEYAIRFWRWWSRPGKSQFARRG